MREPEGHAIYEFGEFRFDAARRLLFAKGAADPLEVPPKALEAVFYFLQRPGELLEKDRLIADLWPDLVVEESSLTHLISVLRRSLGESRGENLYIATVHGRGYRFVADVVRVHEGTESFSEAPPQKPAVEQHSKPSRGPLRVALTTLVVLAVGALFAYGWRTQSPGRDRAVTSLAAASQMSVRSIAVLPFNTLSSAPENEFFAMGLADAILHQLASLSEIVVISGTSSFAFKGSNRDIRDIGRQLNARYVLEGSVQSEKDRLRVTAQLIDSATGGHVWSLRFDRKPDSVFAMQDEIAQEVARALGVSLDPATTKRLAGQGTTNLDAYLAYAKARILLSSRKVADADLAIESLSRAIEIDLGYAAAYAALADAWMSRSQLSYVVSEDVRKQASSTARPLVE
jgi:TolB-like protein/DNA-binding winged helix-turn-helix (wHTH) protein